MKINIDPQPSAYTVYEGHVNTSGVKMLPKVPTRDEVVRSAPFRDPKVNLAPCSTLIC